MPFAGEKKTEKKGKLNLNLHLMQRHLFHLPSDVLVHIARFAAVKPWLAREVHHRVFHRELFRLVVRQHKKQCRSLLDAAAEAWWPHHLLDSEELSCIACSVRGGFLTYAPSKSDAVVRHAVKAPTHFGDPTIIEIMQQLFLFVTRDYAWDACKENARCYDHLPLHLRDNGDIFHAAASSRCPIDGILEQASARLQGSAFYVLLALRREKKGSSLKFAHPSLKDDDAFMARALHVNPSCLQYATARIRSSLQHALRALERNPVCIMYVHRDLRKHAAIRSLLLRFCRQRRAPSAPRPF